MSFARLRLTDYASCSGCAGKIAPGGLTQILECLPRVSDPNVIVGTETHDDAGVYRLSDEIAIVQTIDFFPPVVDDPFIYGQIAAANALSDVYAMGGEPKTVLNLVGYPDDELGDYDWLGRILQGAAERCKLAGAAILGGHSVRDKEIKFGLSVTGVVHPKKAWTNAAAKPGDLLILTKPLGTGFVTTAARKESCPPDVLKAACDIMIELNRAGRDAILDVGGVHSVTDITGFGLCGHAFEMAEGSGTTIAIDVERLPVIAGVMDNDLMKFRTRANKSNRDYVKDRMRIECDPNSRKLEFLWDPQTSGGLLISVEAQRAQKVLDELHRRGVSMAVVIGEVLPKTDVALLVR
jgi:selenide, water dikinase